MMNVKEYAIEMNISVEDIIKKAKEFEIDINNENDILDDEAIIILDNCFNEKLKEEVAPEAKEDEELDERAEDLMEQNDIIEEEVNVEKIKKKKVEKKPIVKEEDNKEYLKEKKEQYKKKSKLQSNKKVIDKDTVIYKDGMSVQDLANELNVGNTEIIQKLMSLGLMISINESIDFDTASIIALEYKKKINKESSNDISNFEEYELEDNPKDLVLRAPVITIMGHVDHGKTTLLDYIRNSNVVSGEAGGITQHIGAYQVEYEGKKLTFIDTPGHAAFTEMRARGASITDIVIIIVAADDGVMPQTKEAIDHSKAAGVPIVVAINKIDKPGSNADKIMSELSELGLTPEEWGGDTMFIKLSAKTGEGIPLLLESLIALSEVKELKSNPNKYATGTVVESRQDKNIGGIVTLLIQNGTLRIGDPIVVGASFGKVRTLKDSTSKDIVSAEPSMPVEITGLNSIPVAGDRFMAFEDEKEAKAVAEKRKLNEKNKRFAKKALSLDEIFESIKEGRKEINIVLKTDVKGSEEAVKNSLEKIDVENVKLNVIRSGVGAITESDIVLANASEAIVIGFNVVPSSKTKDIAKEYNVEIRLYNVIYKLVEEIELAMKGMLDPEYEEVITGEAEVRKLYKFSKVGTIAGCHVTSGIIKRDSQARVIRDSVVIFDGKIGSLQKEKDSVKEMKNGFDCGITIENYSDIKEKDIIEAYEMKEVKRV